MLARRVLAILAIAFLLLPAASFADGSDLALDAKARASKLHDRDGYLPLMALVEGPGTEVEPNDDAASANPLAIDTSLSASLSAGDVDWFVVSCEADGWLSFSTASFAGSYTDTWMEVYAGDGTTLLASDDDSGLGLFSAVLHFPCTAGASYYVVVQHYGTSGTGDYVVAAETGTAPPPVPANDLIAGALLVGCNTVVEGTTLGATDDVGETLDCVGYTPDGNDVFYRVELPYSYQLSLFVDPQGAWDPSVYAFTDPADPLGSCLAGVDLGFEDESEMLIYVNEFEGPPLVLYVGVDSWSVASQGDFLLSVSCEFVVANHESSWGALKASY